VRTLVSPWYPERSRTDLLCRVPGVSASGYGSFPTFRQE